MKNCKKEIDINIDINISDKDKRILEILQNILCCTCLKNKERSDDID